MAQKPTSGGKVTSFYADAETLKLLDKLCGINRLSRSRVLCDLVKSAYEEAQLEKSPARSGTSGKQ